MADLVEGAFYVTVVQGSNVVGEYFIDPRGHARKKFSQLEQSEREFLLTEFDRILVQKPFMEREAENARQRAEAGVTPWQFFWEGIADVFRFDRRKK